LWVGLNLDLKSSMDDCLRSPGHTTAGILAPVVAAEATRRPLLVSSFDPAALGVLRARAPRVPLGLLTWHRFPVEMAVAACVHMDVEVLALHVGSLWEGTAAGQIDSGVLVSLLSLLHRCGRQLLVWCPQMALARLLVSAGTDAVVVDDLPEALVALTAVC
jgi:glycerophosphoryl diester phosphodiesterase